MYERIQSINKAINELLYVESTVKDALFKELEILKELIEDAKNNNSVSDDLADKLIKHIDKIERLVIFYV